MDKRKKIIFLVLTSLAIGLCVVIFAANYRTISHAAVLQQTAVTPSASRRNKYVRRSILHPRLTWALTELGDRLERPGKERTTLSGTISFATDQAVHPITVLNEFPDRVRLDINNGGSERTLIFDGDQSRLASPLKASEQALLETLIYDSSEHFFSSQTQQVATRFIGSRFRIDDGSTTDYQGPYYDVYQVTEPVKTGPDERLQSKFYYFNSDSLLLERVRYETAVNGVVTNVEVLLSDWRKINDQRLPHRIERIENGESKIVFSINSLSILPRVEDGAFEHLPAS